MKASLVIEQFADLDTVTDSLREQIKPKHMGKGVIDYVFPVGTIFEGADAVRMCLTGQCTPADEECAKVVGMDLAKLKRVQVEYQMNTLGINDKKDRELFKAGIIAGYDDKLKYIPGPNWAAYEKAKQEAGSKEDDI